VARSRTLALDRLPDPADAAKVLWLRGLDVGGAAGEVRAPHRHDYHELVWIRSGRGEHSLDGQAVPVRPGTVTLIGRGQVHVFVCARGVEGAVVRFGDQLLFGTAQRAAPGWLLAGRGGRTVPVPAGEADRLESVIAAFDAELRRPADSESSELQRFLIAVVLLWVERWHDAARAESREADDAEVELHRRFTQLLERDFPYHHDAAHYADVLRIPLAALSRALTQVTGRGTKELVTDRVMLEATRLMRFTDLTAKEVAFRIGFADAFYFSRAFKRQFGEAPSAYRLRMRGTTKPA
jgi:AraC family transcriptional regulator, transcriptional activator of pobA